MNDLKVYLRNGHNHWLRDLLFLALLFAIPLLQHLGHLPLIDPDEGRYAEIPREMLVRGDLLTPTLNFVKYFEKPPLLYWLNAGSIQLFGHNEFAARLPSALSGLATLLVTYVIARKLYDRRTALLSACILGTSIGFVLQSRIILTDMLLTFCLTGALGSFIVCAGTGEHRRGSPCWYLFYCFSALAVLTKGLIGIVFPAGIIFFYLLLGKKWRLLHRMRLVSGLFLFMAIASPWFIAVSAQNPEFARFFFIHEHFERFTSTVHGRYQPIWFFIPILAATMLPWSFFIPGALARAWRDRRHETGEPGLYLLIWFAVVFLFFSKSGSKLIPYILPVFPPLAILISYRFNSLLEGRGREFKSAAIMLGGLFCLLAAAMAGFGQLPAIIRKAAELFPRYADTIRPALEHAPTISGFASLTIALLALMAGTGALTVAGRPPLRLIAVLLVSSFILEIQFARQLLPEIAAGESTRELAKTVTANLTPETGVITWGPMQGVNWYTGRRTATFFTFDELEFGSKQGDQSGWFFAKPDELLTAWNGKQHLLFIVPKGIYEIIQHRYPLPNARIVGRSGKYLLLGNH